MIKLKSLVPFLFSATEESKEADAFGNFLTERREVVQVRNKKCAVPDGPWWTLTSDLCWWPLTSDSVKKNRNDRDWMKVRELRNLLVVSPCVIQTLTWNRDEWRFLHRWRSDVRSELPVWSGDLWPVTWSCSKAAPQRRSLPIETNLYFYIRKDFILLFSCSSFCWLLFVKHWHWLPSAK